MLRILDRELSEKLQLTPDLKLEGAIERARQSEMVKSQIKDQSLSHKHVEGVRKSTDGTSHNNHSQQNRKRRGPPKNTRQPRSNNSTDQFQSQSRCLKCNLRHSKDKCFAKGKQCRRCHGYNHFAICCHRQAVDDVHHLPATEDSLFLEQ